MNWGVRTSYVSNRSAFVDELSFLNRKQGKATPPIRVTQFGLFLREDQTVKWKGRIGNSSLQISTKFPILLPAKHAFVSLLVKRTHDRVKHSGINATLKAVRERFWILCARETVKQILRHCVVCRRYDAVPCKPLKFAELPSNRVSEDPPFSHIGLHFAGPLHVEDQSTCRNRKRFSKHYYQGIRLFVYVHVNSGRPSRTDCTGFSVSLPEIRQ